MFAALVVSPLYWVFGASPHDGTTRVYESTVDQVTLAMTNAFSSRRYHDMAFLPAQNHYDTVRHRWSGRPATNEWRLYSVDTPLTTVRLGKATLPYSAEFNITAEGIPTNRCSVTVRTTWSVVPGGREAGVHGGWAIGSKHIPPVLQEETNVLVEVEKQIRGRLTDEVEGQKAPQSGRTPNASR